MTEEIFSDVLRVLSLGMPEVLTVRALKLIVESGQVGSSQLSSSSRRSSSLVTLIISPFVTPGILRNVLTQRLTTLWVRTFS